MAITEAFCRRLLPCQEEVMKTLAQVCTSFSAIKADFSNKKIIYYSLYVIIYNIMIATSELFANIILYL